MQLRPYQTQFIQDLRQAIADGHRRCLGFLPTGAGKTVIAAQITQNAVRKGHSVLFLAHRTPLIWQTQDKFNQFGIETGVIKSGYPSQPYAPAQIAQIQTLAAGNVPIPDWQVLIIDEAHYTSFFKVVERILEAASNDPRKVVLGLTATPYRLGKKSLADYYTTLIQGTDYKTLTEQGFLVPARYFGHERLNLKQVGVTQRTGDFDEQELQRTINLKVLNAKLAQEYCRLARQRRGIIFAVGIDHARAIAQEFDLIGIAAAVIDGTMPESKRERVYTALKQGAVQVIVSVATLTEGFDEPLLECVVLARPTLSRALYMQIIGRGLRLCPDIGKTDCLVYDFGTGNVDRFGRITDPLELQLHCSPIKESSEIQVPCPRCSALVTPWHKVCPECRTVLVEPSGEEPDLLDVVPNEAANEQLDEAEETQKAYYRQLLRITYEKRYKPGYAVAKFKERYGTYPPSWWGQGTLFGSQPTEAHRIDYLNYLIEVAEQHKQTDQWVERHLMVEFGSGFNVPSLAAIAS